MAISRDRAHSAMDDYETALAESGLAASTRRLYWSRISAYLAWLVDGRYLGPDADPLADAFARNAAVRDYRAWLADERGAKPNTVNAALTALDHFYAHLQLGPVPGHRREQTSATPRILAPDEQQAFLNVVHTMLPVRDQAIAHALLDTGVRVGEIVKLDLNHLHLAPRRARIVLTETSADASRELPLEPRSRTILGQWVDERRHWRNANDTTAVFLNKRGGRLSSRSIDDLIATAGNHAGLNARPNRPPVTPQVLRHTYAHRLLHSGAHLEELAQLLGHQRLDTTRRYLDNIATATLAH
jgi:integrase/recombinase XerC